MNFNGNVNKGELRFVDGKAFLLCFDSIEKNVP